MNSTLGGPVVLTGDVKPRWPIRTDVYFAAGAGWASLVGGTIPFRRK
jgi:hypothetical protein